MGDGIGTVRVPMNADLWIGLEKSPDPGSALRTRALEELRRHGYREDEVRVVAGDPVFAESCSTQYNRAVARFHGWRRSLPSSLSIEFQLPGTKRKDKAVSA
jgi:cytosine/adenosine deaminase-related metal-dependent hydrolase